MLETGFQIDSLRRAQSFTTYESHVLFALRFMIDCSISGGNWVELKQGAFKLVPAEDPRKQSHCQLEAHVNYKDIISHPAEGELSFESPASGRKHAAGKYRHPRMGSLYWGRISAGGRVSDFV